MREILGSVESNGVILLKGGILQWVDDFCQYAESWEKSEPHFPNTIMNSAMSTL